jgi:hypothetical protein
VFLYMNVMNGYACVSLGLMNGHACVSLRKYYERTCTRSCVAYQHGSPIWRSASNVYIMTLGNTAVFPETC